MKNKIINKIKDIKVLNIEYQRVYWKDFDYSILTKVVGTVQHYSHTDKDYIRYNNVIIMADTETSKSAKNKTYKDKDGTTKYINVDNYIVAWSIALRCNGMNIVTLYGRRPTEFVKCLQKLQASMNENAYTVVYWHNMTYDWTFIRQYMFDKYDYPTSQLNVNSHAPILIEWEKNKLKFRDSLILAQRTLEKWASDMDVAHKKAKGKWDYDKIRTQVTPLDEDEMEYIENDVLAGVECLDKMMTNLNRDIQSIHMTSTGIPRQNVQKLAKANKFRKTFLKLVPRYEQYLKLRRCYHGGFTHANRNLVEVPILKSNFGLTKCFDFASSYPFCMIAYKFPMSGFFKIEDVTVQTILEKCNDWAFMFKIELYGIELKDSEFPMPALQYSKSVECAGERLDNGRILSADKVTLYLTDPDLQVIVEQYNCKKAIISECEIAKKGYLPRWFTDYVYECFINKTQLKGGDKVLYNLAKSVINSLYGMLVQTSVRDEIVENYETGEYNKIEDINEIELYNKYVENSNSVLPYHWGVWVTSYAFRNLFELGKCCETWVYSDTDSCYGINWDEDKVNAYNENCKALLKANRYGCVMHNDREYWLGVAEHEVEEDTYDEFKVMGAKRYCGRHSFGEKDLKITVAGVPKKTGVKCLNNDISNFKKGFVFDGLSTGKKTHTYIYHTMYIDDNGNECADCIDLTPCDYKLDAVCNPSLDLEEFDVLTQVYM